MTGRGRGFRGKVAQSAGQHPVAAPAGLTVGVALSSTSTGYEMTEGDSSACCKASWRSFSTHAASGPFFPWQRPLAISSALAWYPFLQSGAAALSSPYLVAMRCQQVASFRMKQSSVTTRTYCMATVWSGLLAKLILALAESSNSFLPVLESKTANGPALLTRSSAEKKT